MASIEEVRGAIAQAVDKANASAKALQEAATLAEDAQALLNNATQGSAQHDVENVNAQFAQVTSGVSDLQKYLEQGITQAEAINSRL